MASNLTPRHGQDGRVPDKKALRKEVKQQLSSLTEDEISKQSATARDALLSLQEYQQAKRISIFMSMPGREISTSEVVDHALESGKQVFVPYIYKEEGKGDSVMDMLLLRSIEDRTSLQPDKWGIPSISGGSVSERENCFGGKGLTNGNPPSQDASGLDLVIMPAMAFDHELNRLGHGKAYYDTFIKRCCKDGRRKPFLVGLALAEQILPPQQCLPTESWDWPVDVVVVGDGRLLKADK